MAAEAGLLPADRRSSAGICFIGEPGSHNNRVGVLLEVGAARRANGVWSTSGAGQAFCLTGEAAQDGQGESSPWPCLQLSSCNCCFHAAELTGPTCLASRPCSGRRNFGDFLSQYLPPLPGAYVDVDSGRRLGPCPDLHAVTHGQRPGIGGAHDRVYCVGKDVVRGCGWLADGAVYCRQIWLVWRTLRCRELSATLLGLPGSGIAWLGRPIPAPLFWLD